MKNISIQITNNGNSYLILKEKIDHSTWQPGAWRHVINKESENVEVRLLVNNNGSDSLFGIEFDRISYDKSPLGLEMFLGILQKWGFI